MMLKWKLLPGPFQKKGSKYAAIIPAERCALKLDYTKDVAFCVGIEKYPNECFCKDATDMRDALIANLGLNADKVKISITSDDQSDCTKKGILTSFKECAKKAEKDGNFIFYFSGHGSESAKGCNLVATDFRSRVVKSGISGDDLVQSLKDAECKASNIILIFDCCYAGSLGESLTSEEEWTLAAKPFVMCACAASEESMFDDILKNSIFTYFLLDFFKTSDCKNEFEIQRAADNISKLCYARYLV